MKKVKFVVPALIPAFTITAALLVGGCDAKKDQTEEKAEEQVKVDTTTLHHDMEMDAKLVAYACPMHPEVTGKAGDSCSKCGMTLEAVKTDSTKVHEEHKH